MITLNNLSKQFGQKIVFEGVNFQFKSGKSYALIGKSGSGKTTLLNSIARLERQTSGEIFLDGKDIWHMKESNFFKNQLGYIFQNFALIDDATFRKTCLL
jgi:putative ABC transport system ATP-binding protein